MSVIFSAGLQTKIYQRLVVDPDLGLLIGSAIYDAPPPIAPDRLSPDFVTLGEEAVRPFDTKTSFGAVHDFTVNVHSGRDGFDFVKRVAAAVCAALVDAPLTLDAGKLVGLRFLRASAERGPAPEKRRITLRFRAVVDED